jgi:hypothetical protein
MLQELLAPRQVMFFLKGGKYLGEVQDLKHLIHDITKLPLRVLEGMLLDESSIYGCLAWTENRTATREVDKVHSLLGIFGIFMPLMYGEAKDHAFKRLCRDFDEHRYPDQVRPSPFVVENSV